MKYFKFLATALAVATAVNASALALPESIDNLYIVGEGAPAKWDRGVAPQMVKGTVANEAGGEDVVFTWRGNLAAGSVKFLTSTGSWDSLVSDVENSDITVGEAMTVVYCTESGEGSDYPWNIAEAGGYAIEVNVTKSILTVTKADDLSDLTTVANLYLVGGASPAGWSREDAPELAKEGNVYTWSGNLNDGDFKFVTSRDSWTSLVASQDYLMVYGEKDKQLPVQYGDFCDYKWKVNAGRYNLTVNLDNARMTVEEIIPASLEEVTHLFLVGNASGFAYDRGQALRLVDDGEGVFSWTGLLKAGDFKFVVSRNSWTSLVAPAENMPVDSPSEVLFSEGNPDYKWVISEDGEYVVTVDIPNRLLTVTDAKDSSVGSVAAADVAIRTTEGQIRVSASEAVAIMVCDLSGKTIAASYGNDFTTAVAKGFYIVKAGNAVRKIAVK